MIIAANFKCNHTRKSYAQYAQKLNAFLRFENNENIKVYVAPSFSAFLDSEFAFKQCAQNIYPDFKGAFTGEIGLNHLQEFGIKSVILGHCERRTLGENDEFLAKKFDFCKANDLEIIYCIGEDFATYEKNKSIEFLSEQIKYIDLTYSKLILAYEPIYSIGKSAAKIKDIQKIMAFLKSKTKQPILYGGSVNMDNIKQISTLCDGVLIGSASLDVDNFIHLINKTK